MKEQAIELIKLFYPYEEDFKPYRLKKLAKKNAITHCELILAMRLGKWYDEYFYKLKEEIEKL